MYGSVTMRGGQWAWQRAQAAQWCESFETGAARPPFFLACERRFDAVRVLSLSIALSLAVRINRAQECVSVRQDSRVLVRVEFT